MSRFRLEPIFTELEPTFSLPERHPLVERYRRDEALRRFLRPVVSRFGCWLDSVTDPLSCREEIGARLLRCQRLFVEKIEAPIPPEGDRLGASVALLEALSREGRRHLAEIVAITYTHGHLWKEEALVQLCRPLLDRFPRRRIGKGIALWLREHDLWLQIWQNGRSDRDLLEGLRQKARYGIGHHRNVQLKGRPLDDWLADFLQGDATLLGVLKGELGRLRAGCRFGGPMFGVFSEEELDALETATVPDRFPSDPPRRRPPSGDRDEPHPLLRKASPARLYHTLLTDPEAAVPAASRYVERLCRKAETDPPFGWKADRFRTWLDRRYSEALSPPPAEVPRLPREVYPFLLEQFAPFVLLDGCWLLMSARIARRAPEVGRRLFRIYFDELGSGLPERHHGNLYLRLLSECGVPLPPVPSEPFVHHPGFLSRAFDFPALLLAIGHLPERFLPELLGLNLAIEMSGLGAFYRDLARDLEYWGLDATIVRLHQAIDNPASGHTALAREAIERFLAEAPDSSTRAFLWRRIWRGYRLLETALRPFLRQLAFAVLWRYGGAILGLWWRRKWGRERS